MPVVGASKYVSFNININERKRNAMRRLNWSKCSAVTSQQKDKTLQNIYLKKILNSL